MATNKPQEESSLIVQQSNEIIPATFDSPVLTEREASAEFLALMQENLEDVPLKFPRIKIPSGGGSAFEMPGEDEAPLIQLDCIILDQYRVNAYWPEEEDGAAKANQPPSCFAMDAKTGTGEPGGDCARCPMNQWQSSSKGKGKACKNIRRVYILLAGSRLPHLLTLPPTSLEDFNSHMIGLTDKGIPYYGISSKAKLYKKVSAQGKTYSVCSWAKGEKLSPEETKLIREYIKPMKKFMRNVGIDEADYSTGEDSGASAAGVDRAMDAMEGSQGVQQGPPQPF